MDFTIGIVSGSNFSPLTPVGQMDYTRNFWARSNVTYYIAVESRQGFQGPFDLDLNRRFITPNDFFENAQRLEGSHVHVEAGNQRASSERNEPIGSTHSPRATLWYSRVAPEAGTVMVQTFLDRVLQRKKMGQCLRISG